MPEIVLPPPGPHMLAKLEHPARHKILNMGRRWRKTTLGILAGLCGHGPRNGDGTPKWIGALYGGNIWLIGQSHPESTSVWEFTRDLARPVAKHISEVNRKILFPGGGAFSVKSAVKVNALVGDIDGLNGVIMNEGAKFVPEVWRKAIRPALALRSPVTGEKGWSIWPTTPEGHNYFKELYDKAADPEKNGTWARWTEPSTSNPDFDPEEIEDSRREGMTEEEIQQEYFAKFIVMGPGRTYHQFDRGAHCREFEISPLITLDLCFSFAVAPTAFLVTQGTREHGPERVIDEIRNEQDLTTRGALDEFRRRYPNHANGMNVRVFGEVHGQSTGASDFELVRQMLPRAKMLVRHVPFDPKDRVNAVNNALCDRFGHITAFVDPSCERLIRDLEFTRNTPSSFKVDQEPGLGWHATAWAAKLCNVYPAVVETARAVAEERRWPEATPAARRAYNAVQRALKAGRLVRPSACDQCGAQGKPEAAHTEPGYLPENDLKIRWLCRRCHTAEDLTRPKGGTLPAA